MEAHPPTPSDLAQATIPSAPQQSSGKAWREGARHVPLLAEGAASGGTAAAGRTEPSPGGTGGEGTPTHRPVPWAARDGCWSRRGVCDPPPSDGWMEPPIRWASSSLGKRLCQNRTRALRFGGTLLAFNQPAAPIHRALPFLNYSAVGASGGQRQRQCGCHCMSRDRQTDTSHARSPGALTGGLVIPLPPQSRTRGLSGSTELFPRSSDRGPPNSPPSPA